MSNRISRLLRLWYPNLDIILPSYTLLCFHYIICFTILLLLGYIMYLFLFLSIHIFHIQLFIISLHPFGYLSQSLSISPLILSLLCLSIIYINNFLILHSHHCILSLLLLHFSIPNHHTQRRTKPETLYFELFPQIFIFCTWIIYFLNYCIFKVQYSDVGLQPEVSQ